MQKGKEKFETLRGRLVHQFLRVFTLIRLSWLSLLFIINITQILLSNRCSTGLPFCFELSQKSFTLLKQLDFLVRRVSSLKAQCRVASKILKNRLYLTNAQTIDCCAKVHNSETGYSPPSHPPFSEGKRGVGPYFRPKYAIFQTVSTPNLLLFPAYFIKIHSPSSLAL